MPGVCRGRQARRCEPAFFGRRKRGRSRWGYSRTWPSFSRDVFTVPAEAIVARESVLTMVGGGFVHHAGVRK
jgi:hypothetical protein